ncbi:MAG: LuxR C-terminal-related transcriptional regulator [Streptosporangiaceae bacterium]
MYPDRPLDTLTDREREALREVARGLSHTEIGERLHMSGATARPTSAGS